jgi:hypothetical protein
MAIEERFFSASGVESLSAHLFCAVMWDYALDNKTRGESLAALNASLSQGDLSLAEQDDLNLIADAIDAELGSTDKLFKALDYEMVLRQTEANADYTTLAAMRARLGI